MYTRIVHAGFVPETIPDLVKFYNEQLIPQLEQMPGCLYAGVIVNEPQRDEGFSITLWDSLENLEAYEKSGIYERGLEAARPFLQAASQQKLQLSKDMKLEYVPVIEDPDIHVYESVAQTDPGVPGARKDFLSNLRLVTVKIQEDRMEIFKQLYESLVIPALREVKGCRYAFLIEGLEERNEAISITFWDSKEDIENYESSGLFEKLNNKIRHLYTGIFKWKLESDDDESKQTVTSDDLMVNHCTLLTGVAFKRK